MMCMTERPPALAVSIGSDRLRKVDAACPDFGDKRNQVRKGPAEPIQFPNNEGVARAKGGKGCIKSAARCDAAAYTLIREDALATGSSDSVAARAIADNREVRCRLLISRVRRPRRNLRTLYGRPTA